MNRDKINKKVQLAYNTFLMDSGQSICWFISVLVSVIPLAWLLLCFNTHGGLKTEVTISMESIDR